MDSAGPPDLPSSPSVFLSYASEDRAAARSIRDVLAAAGLEVWYDENELGGGDAWDQKIRRQIRECDFFMPVISAQTQARHEGYFRREWRLAVDRTLDMADGHLFLIPVVLDGTSQDTARVPESFVLVQWVKVPNGQPTPALSALCERLTSGREPQPKPARRAALAGKAIGANRIPRALPEFPTEEPGQRVKFWVHVVGWLLKSGAILFQRLPRIVRVVIYLWLFAMLLSRGCSRTHKVETAPPISPEAAAKLKAISENYKGSTNIADVGKLGLEIARAFDKGDKAAPGDDSVVLAIPFNSTGGSPDIAKLADSAFAVLYGRLAMAHQGDLGLSKEPLASLDPGAAAVRGRASHSKYVICGGIETHEEKPVLTVDIVEALGGSVAWSKSYPAETLDGAKIADDVEAHMPTLDDN
jgi:hypothetical protein